MTREEAIQWLKALQESTLIYGEHEEAIDMAIESLSEPSLKAIKKQIDEHWYLDKSDIINREDAINALESNKSDWNNDYNRPIEKDIHTLKMLPSAEQVTSKLESIEIPTDADEKSTMSQPNSKLEPSLKAIKNQIDEHWYLDKSDLISRADAKEALTEYYNYSERMCIEIKALIEDVPSADAVDVHKAHEEEHLNIVNRIKELQYAIAKTQTIVGKLVESAEMKGGADE